METVIHPAGVICWCRFSTGSGQQTRAHEEQCILILVMTRCMQMYYCVYKDSSRRDEKGNFSIKGANVTVKRFSAHNCICTAMAWGPWPLLVSIKKMTSIQNCSRWRDPKPFNTLPSPVSKQKSLFISIIAQQFNYVCWFCDLLHFQKSLEGV